MSLEKLAKVLHVDEVKLMHGPKGVAVHVRMEKSWNSTTIDNEELEGRRLEVIAEHLIFLVDGNAHEIRGGSRRSLVARRLQEEVTMRSDADQAARWATALSRQVYYQDQPGSLTQQQVQKSEIPYMRPVYDVRDDPPVPEPEMEPMPSRFHAVMAELRCL